jgi:beta-phosphoglucomutase family hydrolase
VNDVLRAAIFDMDGTLVDNMAVHNAAWVELAHAHGIEMSADRFQNDFAGKKNEEILPDLLGRNLAPDELARLAETKESRYREEIRSRLVLVEGADAWLRALLDAGVALAVASSAPIANRDLVLDGLGIRSLFRAVVGAEHVARGKPSPDIFLAAAVALGVVPSECVVFEDAVNGVTAGVAAGMTVVGITTCASAERLRGAGADYVVAHFGELPEELRQRLLGAADRP